MSHIESTDSNRSALSFFISLICNGYLKYQLNRNRVKLFMLTPVFGDTHTMFRQFQSSSGVDTGRKNHARFVFFTYKQRSIPTFRSIYLYLIL